jgi:hypothetical protein
MGGGVWLGDLLPSNESSLLIDLIDKKLSGFRGIFALIFRSRVKRFFFRFFPQF